VSRMHVRISKKCMVLRQGHQALQFCEVDLEHSRYLMLMKSGGEALYKTVK
jgi:hypothetical protein